MEAFCEAIQERAGNQWIRMTRAHGGTPKGEGVVVGFEPRPTWEPREARRDMTDGRE